MAEYIEREAIKYEMWAVGPLCSPMMCVRKATVDRIPAADVAPVVHGRWVPFHSEAAGDIQYCSACDVGFAHRTDFCPNCGAKMDGE